MKCARTISSSIVLMLTSVVGIDASESVTATARAAFPGAGARTREALHPLDRPLRFD